MGVPVSEGTAAAPVPWTTASLASPLRVGIVGAGAIHRAYTQTMARMPDVAIVAVADLDPARAAASAAEHPGVRASGVDELLAADDVDLVLNLTIPAAHAEVALRALAAGKHVYGEKPLAASVASAHAMVDAAAGAGRVLTCAPDTVLGTGTQTARHAIAAGTIGRPTSATAFFTAPGHELWHPDPDFYYAPGGGPLLDMGPYYVTALVHLLGPVTSVVGAANRARAERTIGSGARAGVTVPVDVDTHVTGVLEHASGALSTLVMSFDTWRADLPNLLVHGTSGSLSVPDPNGHGGDVRVAGPATDREWVEVPPAAGYVGAGRGIGVLDAARALAAGTTPRASDAVALHVLDVMATLLQAAQGGGRADVSTTCEVPPLVPLTPVG